MHLIHHCWPPVCLLPLSGPAYHLEVIVFATLSTLLSVHRTLLGWVPLTTILAHHHVEHHTPTSGCSADSIQEYGLLDIVYHTFCALCTSNLCVQLNMQSLVASFMLSRVVTFINISSVMSSSFSPPINCSVNNLSGSLYSHSANFVHSLPVHS